MFPLESPLYLMLGVLGIVLLVLAIRFAAKQAYIGAVERHGWTFHDSPGPASAYGLNVPPFGLGASRQVDDLITGSVQDRAFSVFAYRYAGVPRRLVARFPLAAPRAEAHLALPGAERPQVVGVRVPASGVLVASPDAAWAGAVAAATGGAYATAAAAIPRLTVSLDGDSLVAEPLPREPDDLARALDLLVPVVRAVDALPPSPAPVVPTELSVYRRPTWIYRARDDSWLDTMRHNHGGDEHEARDVIIARAGELRVVALEHHWQTTSTTTVRNADGTTRTETHTHHHQESLVELALGFPFGDLSVNWGVFGRGIRFESEQFNRAFRVRSADERFAYDVIHGRTMEWFLDTGGRPFAIEQGRMFFEIADASPQTVDECLTFAQGFFGRVRSYTWQNLGLAAPPALG